MIPLLLGIGGIAAWLLSSGSEETDAPTAIAKAELPLLPELEKTSKEERREEQAASAELREVLEGFLARLDDMIPDDFDFRVQSDSQGAMQVFIQRAPRETLDEDEETEAPRSLRVAIISGETPGELIRKLKRADWKAERAASTEIDKKATKLAAASAQIESLFPKKQENR